MHFLCGLLTDAFVLTGCQNEVELFHKENAQNRCILLKMFSYLNFEKKNYEAAEKCMYQKDIHLTHVPSSSSQQLIVLYNYSIFSNYISVYVSWFSIHLFS